MFNKKWKYPAMPVFDLDDSSKLFKAQRMSMKKPERESRKSLLSAR